MSPFFFLFFYLSGFFVFSTRDAPTQLAVLAHSPAEPKDARTGGPVRTSLRLRTDLGLKTDADDEQILADDLPLRVTAADDADAAAAAHFPSTDRRRNFAQSLDAPSYAPDKNFVGVTSLVAVTHVRLSLLLLDQVRGGSSSSTGAPSFSENFVRGAELKGGTEKENAA